MEIALNVANVEKTFDGPYKLGPINFNLHAGDTVALFGKNGAGKTTLFQIITGSMDATDGVTTFLQKKMTPEAFELKRHIGYLPQDLGLPRWVNGAELLAYGAKLYNLNNLAQTVDEALDYWDCSGFRHRPLAACSHGMQKRIGLALASIHNPDLMILDEPFSGLDLFHIRALDGLIRKRNSQKKITIISTHVAPYAASLCNRSFILENGKMHELNDWPKAALMDRMAQVEKHFFSQTAPGNH